MSGTYGHSPSSSSHPHVRELVDRSSRGWQIVPIQRKEQSAAAGEWSQEGSSMRIVTMRHILVIAGGALVLAVLAVPAMNADANPIPVWNHYKTYVIMPQPTYNFSIELDDQFGRGLYHTMFLDQLGLPAIKNNEPVADTTTHYTWWTIEGEEPGRKVVVENQFGEQGLFVKDVRYLWNPAVKNPQPGTDLPTANHYKCYDATGPPVEQTVTLQTQFGFEDVVVKEPEVFCNPAKKTDQHGNVFPIVDEHQHYVCYWLDPPTQLQRRVVTWDQFLVEEVTLEQNLYLCVPSLKTGVVQVEESTWGRLKSIYR
jgi:hypothetical protein